MHQPGKVQLRKLNDFYNDISNVIDIVLSVFLSILMGDFHAKVQKKN